MSTPRTVRLSPNDNVVVAVDPIPEGTSAAGVTARARVMRGHKMAIAPIGPGEWVHTQNVEMHDFARDYRFAEGAKNDEVLPPELRETFESAMTFGRRTLEAIGLDAGRADIVEDFIRTRDRDRIAIQQAEGIYAGIDLLRRRPVMAPFSEPQREGKALNEEAEEIIEEKEEAEG